MSKSKSNNNQFGLFLLDIIMIVLLLLNLNLIVFDWLFQSETIRDLLEQFLPAFTAWYNVHIHQDFLRIDLIFVAIFLAEFFFHWAEDIYHKRHPKWYYYPILYWYDILGCIPIGTLRFLRLLRFVSIIHRLHRMKIIDVTKNPFFEVFSRFANIIIEEITDRVIIRILRNVKDEIQHGTPIIHKITDDVIKPQKQKLIEWLSGRIRFLAEQNAARYRDDIRTYVDRRIGEAVEQNEEINNLRLFPVIGNQIEAMIEKATADIVFNVINGAIADLGSPDNKVFVEDVTNLLLDDSEVDEEEVHSLNQMVTDLIVQSLDIIIAKVSIKEWQYKDIAQNETLLKQKLKENLQNL